MAGKQGKSGRKPKPLSVLKLTGTYRADRHAATEINLPAKAPAPPPHITGEARREWFRVVKLLAKSGCVTELDLQPLAAYCIEFEKYKRANDDISKVDSLLVRSTKGTAMLHPLLKASDHALLNMLRIAGEFGLTILSRRTLRLQPKSSATNDKSRFFQKYSTDKEA
jgi:P27 family predicted phage terminase small subunit